MTDILENRPGLTVQLERTQLVYTWAGAMFRNH